MTALQMYEAIKQHDPSMGLNEALVLLNQAMKDFVFETRILEKQDTSLTTIADTDGYSIPSGIFRVNDVRLDGEAIYRMVGRYIIGDAAATTLEYFWQIDNDKIRITYDGGTFEYPAAGKAITVVGNHYDTDLTAVDSEPSFPENYHMALVYRVLADAYMKPMLYNINNSAFYRAEYDKLIAKGRKYARSRKHALGSPAPVYF